MVISASTLGFRLSRGVLGTITPPIPTAKSWAAQYVPTASRPLLDMSQGVPGVLPPKFLQEALGAASSSSASFGYCPADGEPALRKSLSEEMKHIYGANTDVEAEDIALTAGCNMAFVATIMSLADAGDEVILPVPWYFNQQMDLTLLGMVPVALQTLPQDGFQPSVEECRSLITSKTRAIALVTPNNPTGAIYSISLLSSFLELAREHKIALIIDETYRDFLLDGPPHSLFNTNWRSNLVSLYSFSKSYCLPGHRLGAIVASPTLLKEVKTVLDCLQICPPRPIQQALTPLLPSMRPFVHETAAAIATRHHVFRNCLPKRWKVGSQGGYYAFVQHPFVGISSLDVCKRLATEIGVVALPSAFFSQESSNAGGAEGDSSRWIRFSVANVGDEQVRMACERLEESEKAFGWKLDGPEASHLFWESVSHQTK